MFSAFMLLSLDFSDHHLEKKNLSYSHGIRSALLCALWAVGWMEVTIDSGQICTSEHRGCGGYVMNSSLGRTIPSTVQEKALA